MKQQLPVEKEDAPFLSIIVPVYNVEDDLCQCLDSILNQDCADCELVIVDDGSRDGCARICDGYAEKHDRVRVIHKRNGGLSDARNAGIRAATGTYLIFIDGDDFIAEDSLRRIAESLRGDGFPDVLFLNALMYYRDGSTKPYGHVMKREEFYGQSRSDVLERLASGAQFHVSACLKAVKRRLLLDRGIFFWPGIVGEDVDYSTQLYLAADTYSHCDAPYYYYRRQREGSIMAQKCDARFADLLSIIGKWTDLAEAGFRGQRDWILRFMFHQYYTLLLLYQDVGAELKTARTRADVDRLSYLLGYTQKGKAAVLSAAYRMCGPALTSRLLNLNERRS